ncbi:mitochondrial glycerol-3-phosphate dehydrogenase [Rhizina undulata]
MAYKSLSSRLAANVYAINNAEDITSTGGRANSPPKPPKFIPLSTRAEQFERLKAGDLDATSMG